MSEAFDIYTLIFLGLAVFVLVRLRSVLGTRTGHERPPQDYMPREAQPNTTDNVVPLPQSKTMQEIAAEKPSAEQRSWNNAVKDESAASRVLQEIAKKDVNFDVTVFLQNASSAYEMIVTAFGKGDKATLKDLLADDVYADFAAVIAERESKGLHVDTEFVSIKTKSVPLAALEGNTASITVEFLSEMVSITKDKTDTVVEGSPEKIVEVKDVWTFTRTLGSASPIWKVVSTAGEND